MIIYLFVFFLSSLFFYCSECSSNKHIRKLFFCLAIIFPCLLAMLRSDVIGTDLRVYVLPSMDLASSSNSFGDFYNSSYFNFYFGGIEYISRLEPFFVTLVYFVINILSLNRYFLLFLLELLIILPISLGLRKFKVIKNNKLLWLSMLIYYFLFYNLGLNIVRQMIGISFVFLGTSFLINDQNNKFFFVFLFIAILFHKSSILGLLIWGLKYYLDQNQKKDLKVFVYKNIKISSLFLKVLLISIFIGGMLYIPNLMKSFSDFLGGVFNIDFSGYIGDSFGFVRTTLWVIPIFLLIIVFNKNLKMHFNYYLFLAFYIIYTFLLQLSSAASSGSRLSYLFFVFFIVFFPMFFYREDEIISRDKRIVFNLIMIFYCFVYWYFYFIYSGVSSTYPYLFY